MTTGEGRGGGEEASVQLKRNVEQAPSRETYNGAQKQNEWLFGISRPTTFNV